MAVVFLPDFTTGNPYQQNLADALDEEVTIGGGDGVVSMIDAVRSNNGVSIVHFHWLHPYIFASTIPRTLAQLALTIFQLLFLRLSGVSVVWTVHNVMSHESPNPRLERWFKYAFLRLGICEAAFVHCEEVEDSIVEAYRLPESVRDRVRVIPHGHYLDNYDDELSKGDARDNLDIGSDQTVFLYFGQIRPYKGIPSLIETFKRIDAPDARLLVVGNPNTETLESRVRDQCLDDNRIRTHLEFVPDDAIQCYMNAADCVVLPYSEITTSGSAILAMSFGKSVVIPRRGCVPELLDERGSLLYPPDTDTGLHTALSTALDRDLESMGEHNERLVSGYDWDDIADTTSEVYSCVR